MIIMHRSWHGEYVGILLLAGLLPQIATINRLPTPITASPASTKIIRRAALAHHPRSRILTMVPDVWHKHSVYRVLLRTHTGVLRTLYVDKKVAIIDSRVLSVLSSVGKGNARQRAQTLAHSAVGGGRILQIHSYRQNQTHLFNIELLLPNGQLIKVLVNPRSSHIISVEQETNDL